MRSSAKAIDEYIAGFPDELKPFKSAQGSVQSPLDRPLPADLIGRRVAFRAEDEAGRLRGRRE